MLGQRRRRWASIEPTLGERLMCSERDVKWDGHRLNTLLRTLSLTAPAGVGIGTAVQSQKTVSAYFITEQILPFGFAKQYAGRVVRRVR